MLTDELDVLHRQRPVEARAPRACARSPAALAFSPAMRDRRIAGDQPQRQEDDGRHAEQHTARREDVDAHQRRQDSRSASASSSDRPSA